VTSVKHKPAGGIAVPGGLMNCKISSNYRTRWNSVVC